MRKPTYTHTPGSGRQSLGLQHQIAQAAKSDKAKSDKTSSNSTSASATNGFSGDIPPGATIHVVNGVITGHS